MSVLIGEEMAMSKQQVFRQGPVKITRAAVDGAWRKRAPAQRTIISDAECRGLALVVNATSMAWRFEYKPRRWNRRWNEISHNQKIPDFSGTYGLSGAQKRTRTSTPLRAPAPEAGASTNSAIWARDAGAVMLCAG